MTYSAFAMLRFVEDAPDKVNVPGTIGGVGRDDILSAPPLGDVLLAQDRREVASVEPLLAAEFLIACVELLLHVGITVEERGAVKQVRLWFGRVVFDSEPRTTLGGSRIGRGSIEHQTIDLFVDPSSLWTLGSFASGVVLRVRLTQFLVLLLRSDILLAPGLGGSGFRTSHIRNEQRVQAARKRTREVKTQR